MTPPRFLYLAATLAGVLLLTLLYFTDPGTLGFDICFSRRFLHFYCAGCGATRATRFLLHGDFMNAMRYNLIYVILLPFLFYLWIAAGQHAFQAKKRLPFPGFRVLLILLCVLTLFSILRNIPMECLEILRPK